MRLLIDTNVFLEILLAQAHADVVLDLLSAVDEHEFYVSGFSLHSIGLLLLRQRQPEMFRAFLRDLTMDVGVTIWKMSLNMHSATSLTLMTPTNTPSLKVTTWLLSVSMAIFNARHADDGRPRIFCAHNSTRSARATRTCHPQRAIPRGQDSAGRMRESHASHDPRDFTSI